MSSKILIIEDEEILREMYAEKFSQSSFEVTAVEDTRTGLEKARDEKPDIILLDMLLPKEGGLVFLRKQKEDPKIKDLKVVAFSNYDGKGIREKTTKLGVKDYLIKTDFTPSEIAEKMKQYL